MAKYECWECMDTGTYKTCDHLGNKIWVDCTECDAARKRTEEGNAKHAALVAERDRYRQALEHALALLEGEPRVHRELGAHCGEDLCGLCLVEGRIEEALALNQKEVRG